MGLEHIVINNIKRIRKEKHVTQEQLAEFCGTSASYIGLMETYKNIPKLSTIERIAEALNVPVLDLFTANETASIAPTDAAESAENAEKSARENERKQKIREHLKNEILSRLSDDLDTVLQLL